MQHTEKELFGKIDEILWLEWDPIGVNDAEEIRDEYRGYVPHVFSLKMAGADERKIAQHLFRVETIDIGTQGNMEHCLRVARMIVALGW